MGKNTKAKHDDKRAVTTMRMPQALLDRLDVQAKAEGRTRSNLAEVLLTQGVAKREKDKSRNVFG